VARSEKWRVWCTDLRPCRTSPPEWSLGGAAIGAGFLLLIVAAGTVPRGRRVRV